MQIILLESIDRVGKAGEIVSVKDGYANNFLLPKKIGIVANKKNKENLNNKLEDISKENDKKIIAAGTLKESLDKIELNMHVEANDEDILYGSISQKQVSDLLKAKGYEILNENIIVGDIRNIGEFEVKIKIYEDISSTVSLTITKN